jgi:hypothetical protein
MSLQTNQTLALENDVSFCGTVHTRDQVENGSLAGAIRSDNGNQLTRLQFEVEILHSPQAAEIMGEVFDVK